MIDDYCSHGCDCDLTSLNLPQSTPTLYGEDAVNFIKKVDLEANQKVGLVPTPKLGLAVKKVQTQFNTNNVG